MKKMIAIIMMSIILTVTMTGCGQTYPVDESHPISEEDNRFTIINTVNGCIYVDKETKCQYLCVISAYGVGLILLVDSDCTPKLYEE